VLAKEAERAVTQIAMYKEQSDRNQRNIDRKDQQVDSLKNEMDSLKKSLLENKSQTQKALHAERGTWEQEQREKHQSIEIKLLQKEQNIDKF
jgi:hypothetical protein